VARIGHTRTLHPTRRRYQLRMFLSANRCPLRRNMRWASRLAAPARGDYALPNPRTEDTPMPAPLTRSLGSFAASLKYEMLPEKAIEAAPIRFTARPPPPP